MRNFDYDVADRLSDAFATDDTRTMAIAGGTELLNWFRLGIAAPEKVIDIGRIAGMNTITRSGDLLSIFASTDDCVAVQPSEPLVALAALDAEVEIAGHAGHRTMSVADLLLTQQEAAAAGLDAARAETRLKPGEIIVGYHLRVREGARS